MTPPPKLFQALLRPAILQILRVAGFHATRPAVLDTLAELAAAYLQMVCAATATHARAHQHLHASFEETADDRQAWVMVEWGAAVPTVVDLRMALQDVGALAPERMLQEQMLVWPQREVEDEEWLPHEDVRGVQDFISWFSGPRMKELLALTRGDGGDEGTDYLNALIKKHSKTGEDSKYHGTLLRHTAHHITHTDPTTPTEILVEGSAQATAPNPQPTARSKPPSPTSTGLQASVFTPGAGPVSSVRAWQDRMHRMAVRPVEQVDGDEGEEDSSGLSSLGDEDEDEEML